MARAYFLIGLLALGAFSYGQYRGIDLFETTTPTRLRGTGVTSGQGTATPGSRSGGWRSGGVGSHPIFHK